MMFRICICVLLVEKTPPVVNTSLSPCISRTVFSCFFFLYRAYQLNKKRMVATPIACAVSACA